MNILVISPTFPPNRSGGADFAFQLCERLASDRTRIHVITSAIAQVVTSEKFCVSAIMRSWSWTELMKLLYLTCRFRPDVVEIHFAGSIYNQEPMITILPFLLKKFLPRARIVLHVEYPEPIAPKARTFFARITRRLLSTFVGRENSDYRWGSLLRDSDAIIVLCEPHRRLLEAQQSGVSSKCVTIAPPPPIQLFNGDRAEAALQSRLQLRIESKETLLVYYGYIYPNKGLETLLESFKEVQKQNINVRLAVLGGSNEVVLRECGRFNYVRELKDLARELGIEDSVVWTDYLPADDQETSKLLLAADICVLPFDDGVLMHRSTFGVAAVHQLPIVTTRGADLEELFVDDHNVLLCPPKDPEALAARILQVINNAELRTRLRSGARELSDKYFSWDACLRRTTEVFEGLRPIRS